MHPAPMKHLEGWRYLEAVAAPPDLAEDDHAAEGIEALPTALRRALMVLGLT